jgi:hypothetical protein
MTKPLRKGKRRRTGNRSRREGKTGPTSEVSEPSKWTVVVLEVARKEGHKILSDLQYDHVVEILKRLADFGNAEETADLDIEPISSFYELKEKGGPLGRINLRVYFGAIPERREIVIAKAYKKEEMGALPPHVIISVEDRLEAYQAGGFRKSGTVFRETRAKQ